ncbi:filamentous hemagglutinin N-terminal domain-containing protein [Hyphomicrobium methylovorum]|uniref:two-partner secretion domain-containing protein n=1 Tax=Hyphomicrobium methylovorum TaxID=84 RepID=UPI0015E73528|nr:filamentous hemagglutinin N-terminal domain-containing protein [Hyphomicrobium methylovorum]
MRAEADEPAREKVGASLWRPKDFSAGILHRLVACTAIASLVTPHLAFAEPAGGNVVSGAASISQTGPVTNINQTTGKAIINWQGFSVAPHETVNFHQPDASSVTLNRVIGNESSIIQGALNANGQIFLVNSNGILFSDAAKVSVGGIVASTLDISNDDFLAGNYTFAGSSAASVVNKGTISATQGGYVSLLGKTVSNQGAITATLGTVALSAGSKTTLNFGGNSLVDVTIDKGVFNALVENKQIIKADGGQVIMTARAADAVLSAQVNNTGISVQLNGQGFITGNGVGTYDMSLAALTASGNSNYTMNGATGLAIIYQAALPVGPKVISGDNVTVATNGKVMTVGQSSQKAIINWDSFNIGTGYTVAFNQPSSKAVTLNRVIGNEESVISGAMTAPGHVYLVNSAGVLFTGSSRVNVGSLIASTQDMTNTSFLSGSYVFGANAASGWVEAHGDITVSDGGYVGLIGNGVANHGAIKAAGGKVLLAGGSGIGLTVDADGHLTDFSIATANQWVNIGGTIDVSSNVGNGGVIETAGYVTLAPHLSLSASGAPGFANGYWQMKAPGDFNIAAGANIRGADLTRLLGSLDVNVRSNTGNVNVKDAVSWSKNTLSLVSPSDINVSNVMTVTDSASLFASYGITTFVRHLSGNLLGVTQPVRDYTLHGINMAYATDAAGKPTNAFKGKIDFQSSGSLVMGSTGNETAYTVINSVNHLQAINDSADNFASGKRYALGKDLDLGEIDNWTPLGVTGGGTVSFDGVFNGMGHTVSNLTSSRNGLFEHVGRAQFDEGAPSVSDPTVAFGVVPEFAGVSNVGVVNVNVDCTADCVANGSYSIGGLAGYAEGQMTNVFSTGKINARYTASNSAQSSAGGLYGLFSGYAKNNYSTVDLTTAGFAYVGGLTGESGSGYIGNSHAFGSIAFDSLGRTKAHVGGFVGYSHGTTIIASSASGNVTAKGGYVGGFAGYVEMGTLISNSKASGDVYLDDSVYARDDAAGGFVGMIYDGSVAFSSSSGRVRSALGDHTYVGGFSGMVVSGLHGMAVGNFWNVETSGISTNGGGNYEPNHGPGEGTPIVDAYNAQYGTNLTPAQFHGGAVGVNSGDAATLQQQSGDPAALAKSTESIMNGGSPIPTGGGTGTGNGGGGLTPVSPTRPTRTPATGVTPQQYVSSIGAAAVSATVGIEKAREDQVTPSDAKAGVAQTTAKSAPKLDEIIDLSKAPSATTKVSDDDQRRRKKAKRAAAPAADADYGAQIKSIDVDGQRFDLEKKDESPDGGETAAPPSGAP